VTTLLIDPAEPGFFLRPDYYEVLARLRDEAPVFEQAPGVKVLSRYEDIRAVSRDPERFCSGRGVLVNDPLREGGTIEGSILHMDPPRHAEWRRILNREFTGRAVGRLEGEVRALVRAAIDAIPPGEVVDLVDVLSAPIPVLVIAELLGVPDDQRSEFRRWSDATIAATDGRTTVSAEDAQSLGELVAFLAAHARAKAASPGPDVVSLLVQADVGGRPLSEAELVTFAVAADPALVPAAVEECLRWVTPIQQFARTATVATELSGEPIDEGDYLIMLYASGNRDERAFGPTASQFDALRPIAVPNLAFGFGEHLCLGAALARLEARIVFEEILARFPAFEVAGDVDWLASSLVRGPHHVPMVF
jgi:cytochrome P450